MKVLFDQGRPAPLRKALPDHEVKTAFECGWRTLTNGELLSAAEAKRIEVFITTDQNLRHQQSLARRNLAIIVLSTTDWRRIGLHAGLVADALERIAAGAIVEITIPHS